ncbi:DUF2884 domain-containing protein [Ewingella americana]|jgi:hypothetical protein|uniref:DUF2884 family protein n=1 Tax=Ewingella americana TaxID=41202 RepID=A0A502GHT3_9GAMM|nr:DUF2884 domain-containing protein [Ewingella americana]TPG60870.1 DUF2884 family protein [Ewingella americana]
MEFKTGTKLGIAALLAMTAWSAQADYQCNVNPKDDVVIKPQTVQIVGASGNLLITPNGDVSQNGKEVTLSAKVRQEAIDYQASLRRDLPWIDQGATAHLEKGRVAMDNVIVQQLGTDSNVRNRLTTLNTQMKQQMNRIIEHRTDGLTFHHQAVEQVKQDGRRILEQSMGGVMQDSLNEMGVKQATSGGNPLQAVMGNLGVLQQAVQNEWSKQEQDFKTFGDDVCNRVKSLDKQRQTLLADLK